MPRWRDVTCTRRAAGRDAVELVADVVGTDAVRRGGPLERRRRDLATLNHHVTTQPRLLDELGGLWFGRAEVRHPLVDERVF